MHDMRLRQRRGFGHVSRGINLGVNSSSVFYDIAAFEEAGIAAPQMGETWEQIAEKAAAMILEDHR